MEQVGIGVIGLGFMGRTHVQAIQRLGSLGVPCRLAAVCDGSVERLAGCIDPGGSFETGAAEPLFDPESLLTTVDPAELIGDPSVQLVHICTWTDTHVDLAIQALNAGKHVVVEKPVAISSDEVARLGAVSEDAAGFCMPAMCMRFWPGWTWLKARIVEGTFGPVHSAVFRRLGSAPEWGNGFYADASRSGGAVFDLHIHDVDFVTWCFGDPSALGSLGTNNHLTTLYSYDDGPAHVTAEGGWSLAPSAGFRMRYLVCFERATADFDVSRDDPLIVFDDDGSHPVELPELSGYELEIKTAVDAVTSGNRTPLPTIEEAYHVTRLLEAEVAALG